MQVVCEATQATECKVKVAALQCLVRIMSLYYQVDIILLERFDDSKKFIKMEHFLICSDNMRTFTLQHMESYMGPALFAITLESMKSDVDEVALQGILAKAKTNRTFIL